MKYVDAFEKYFGRVGVFTAGDARRFLAGQGASNSYAKLLVHNLAAKGRLARVGRGRYTLARNEALIGFAFEPFYYGLEYALTIRRIWTQKANPVIITATKSVPGTRKVMGVNVTIRRIAIRMLFGYEYISYSGMFVPVSTPEKLLIDLVYYKIRLSPQELRALLDKVNQKRLRAYLRKCPKRIKNSIDALHP